MIFSFYSKKIGPAVQEKIFGSPMDVKGKSSGFASS